MGGMQPPGMPNLDLTALTSAGAAAKGDGAAVPEMLTSRRVAPGKLQHPSAKHQRMIKLQESYGVYF